MYILITSIQRLPQFKGTKNPLTGHKNHLSLLQEERCPEDSNYVEDSDFFIGKLISHIVFYEWHFEYFGSIFLHLLSDILT